MTVQSAQLLQKLSSGVRPAAAAPAPAAQGAQGMFADLLKQAQEGTLVSRVPITIDPGAGVGLSDDQLARLSFAADKLEAAGVRTALVTMDGQRLLLDVHGRRVTGHAKADEGIVSGIDGTLDLGDARTDAPSGQDPAGAGWPRPAMAAPGAQLSGAVSNASLLELLARLHGTPAAG